MSASLRKRMRRQDLTDYIDIGTVKPAFTYETIGNTIKQAFTSLVRMIRRDDDQMLPVHMRQTCFYTRIQQYRPVPARPLPRELQRTFQRTRKGFDPEVLTLSRWKRQNEEALEDEKVKMIKKALIRRNQEPLDEPPKTKLIKRYYVKSEKSDLSNFQWNLIEKKFELAANALTLSNEEKISSKQEILEKKLKDTNESDTQGISQPLQHLEEKESSSSVVTISITDSPEQAQQTQTNSIKTAQENEKQIESSQIIHLEDNKSQEQTKVTSVINPFKESARKPPLNLMDIINKNKQSNTIFPSQTQQQNKSSLPSHQGQTNISQSFNNSHQKQCLSLANNNSNPFNNERKMQAQNLAHVINNPRQVFPPQKSSTNIFQQSGNQSLTSNLSFHNLNQPYQQLQLKTPQVHQVQPRGFYLSGVSNTAMTSEKAKALFEPSHTSKNQNLSFFDTSSSFSDKTHKRSSVYNHKRKKEGPVRIS